MPSQASCSMPAKPNVTLRSSYLMTTLINPPPLCSRQRKRAARHWLDSQLETKGGTLI
jgi:hypothetical protein